MLNLVFFDILTVPCFGQMCVFCLGGSLASPYSAGDRRSVLEWCRRHLVDIPEDKGSIRCTLARVLLGDMFVVVPLRLPPGLSDLDAYTRSSSPVIVDAASVDWPSSRSGRFCRFGCRCEPHVLAFCNGCGQWSLPPV